METKDRNPYWDKPKQPKEPWWENPKFWIWLTVLSVIAIVAVGHQVFWQTVFGAFALAVATGKYKLIDMETEFPDDPDDYPEDYYVPGYLR